MTASFNRKLELNEVQQLLFYLTHFNLRALHETKYGLILNKNIKIRHSHAEPVLECFNRGWESILINRLHGSPLSRG